MQLPKRSVKPWVRTWNRRVERAVNRAVRTRDRALGAVRLGGRAADYDDEAYEFIGGASERMRAKHYDKSLRLLWKAEQHAPWSSFRDCTPLERELLSMADQALDDAERVERARIQTDDFRQMLKDTYTEREREALAAILSAIGHGEAYAWLVASETLREVKSTGAKAAVSMQILEEAKHFVVLRELIGALDVEIPRLQVWEYLLLENALKANDMEKLFGMNVVVEGIAIGIFGMLASMPGLEILRLFHLDESRHTALPSNYFKEFPLTWWQKNSPRRRARRLWMVLPTIPMMMGLEADAAELGIDSFEFGGSVIRKISILAERVGFLIPMPFPVLHQGLNQLFNAYCRVTRDDHEWVDFVQAETTTERRALRIEREVFSGDVVMS